MRRSNALLASVLIPVMAALLAACTQGLSSLTGDEDGIVYHLPRTVLQITVRQYRRKSDQTVWYSLGGPGGAADTKPASADDPANAIVTRDVPDPRHRYVIKYNPSALSDDRLCISRDPRGLLHDVQFAADDRTPEVIFNIARFIGGFIGSPVAFEQPDQSSDSVLVRSYTGDVDPFNQSDVDIFNAALKRTLGASVELDFERMRKTIASTIGAPPGRCNGDECPPQHWAKVCDEKHICYRSRLKLPVELKSGRHRADVKYVDVVNSLDIGSISVTRALLVQKITKLRFENGALVSAIVRKPSEVEEATLLPLNVLNAILSVPSGLFTAAFSDAQYQQKVFAELAKQDTEIKGLNEAQSLLLQGASPTSIESGSNIKENYHLNCSGGSRSGAINILNPNNTSASGL